MAVFSFTSRDFDTVKQELIARADRVFPEWTDRDPSDFGMMMLDLWATAADTIHYYIDRVAGEAFLPTAQQRESVLAIANLLDYVPQGRTSAVAVLTLSNTTNADIVIPAFTEFVARYDDSTYTCYTPSGGTIPSLNTGVITLYEGSVTVDETLTSSASGQGGQSYALRADNVVIDSIQVAVYENGVDPVPYQRISRIVAADSGDRVFVTNVNAEGNVTISFGSTVNGFIPPSGCRITATYATSSGAAGNLPANSIVGFKGAAPIGIDTSPASMPCTAFSGGVNEESIESLKRSIPSVIYSQNRAVTRADFVALALQVAGVAKASVQYIPNAGGASPGNASVFIYPQPTRADFLTTSDTSQAVSADMQAAVVNTIQPRALLGVDVFCADTIQWQPIDVHVTINVNERFVANWVKRDVEAALDELFEFDNVFFGQRLTLGQVYRIILNIPGVDYANVTRFDTTGGTSVESQILIDELELPRKGQVLLTMVGGITTS